MERPKIDFTPLITHNRHGPCAQLDNKFFGYSCKMQATNLAPAVISRLLQEVRSLVKTPPDGITYVENEENSVSEIHAILTGPGTFDA